MELYADTPQYGTRPCCCRNPVSLRLAVSNWRFLIADTRVRPKRIFPSMSAGETLVLFQTAQLARGQDPLQNASAGDREARELKQRRPPLAKGNHCARGTGQQQTS